jgi:hypothetical protein
MLMPWDAKSCVSSFGSPRRCERASCERNIIYICQQGGRTRGKKTIKYKSGITPKQELLLAEENRYISPVYA